jgi:DNA repair ATPase RecN
MEYSEGGMDAELREYLDGKFSGLEQRIDNKLIALEQRIDDKLYALEQRIDDKLYALAKRFDDKLTALAQHILHEMDTRFAVQDKKLESIDSRLKLQAGLVQSGSRSITRLIDYSETSEARWIDLTVRFDSLERRVDKLDPPAQQ